MTFAQLFPENVNGVLKNVEHSLAIKLRRQVSTGTTTNSSPVPSPNGSFTTRRPSTAPGGASPATSSGPGRSVRLGASAGPVARRPNKLHTAPSEHGGSRPPSVSPKPAAVKSRSSVGGSRLFSESSTLSNNSALFYIFCFSLRQCFLYRCLHAAASTWTSISVHGTHACAGLLKR